MSCRVGREDEVSVHDLPLIDQLVRLIRGGGDNAQIGARSADAPKQIRVLLFRNLDNSTIGGDNTCRNQCIGDQAKQARITSNARPDRQPNIAWAGAGAALYLGISHQDQPVPSTVKLTYLITSVIESMLEVAN